MPYVELHCHSAFSFLDGASHTEELVLRAKELGYLALALTDHNGLYGSMEFAHFCVAEGLQPITGAEVTLRGDACVPLWVGSDSPSGAKDRDAYENEDPLVDGTHVTLLAETPTGYSNLCRLVSEAHLESPREDPRLRLSSLLRRTGGLILLTGCRKSPLLRHLDSSVAQGEAFARQLAKAFGPGRVFVELQDNSVRGDRTRAKALARLADRLDLPVVATGNVHYHRQGRSRLQDVLVAISYRRTLDGSHDVRRGNNQFHLAMPELMTARFDDRPDAVANTLRIAERCASFDLTKDIGYEFPDFEGSHLGTAPEILAAVCEGALDEKYPPGSRHREEAEPRLRQELALVERHRLSGFFLVYRDIMELAREVGHRVRGTAPRANAGLPPGRGRGSSVSSIICYLIGLSHIDPMATDLFLGRFLNEAMGSVPDIDLDFPRDIREELILEVYRRYGDEHAGLVCTFPTYRMRSAVREIGKALDLPQGDLEKLAKLAERGSASALRDEIRRIPEFRDKADHPLWEALAELARDVAGLPRHVSQHVGGMIISSRPLVELVPLEPAAWEGRVLCQWDKDSCDDAGFIKIDFLALGMLSLVEEAVDLITVRAGEPPDLSRIDFEDEVLYDRICSGDTVGLFQVESRAQIQMLRRSRPRNLEDLAVQVAIVRPGPIVAGAVNPYVRRRELLREDPDHEIAYDHPLLRGPLEQTLGVIIFQDQVLQVCKALAGFTDGQAEGLRRAMSRKRSREAFESYWEAFRAGAASNGADDVTAKKVFEQVVAFSEFGFPKSHAAAFGLLAYQSAWLRHYHPTEYYVALFNNQPMGFYSLDALGRDARRNGIRILLPNLNQSGVRCTVEGNDLRVGLGFVRGWGSDIAKTVVEERSRNGPFRSLPDFLRRTPAALRRPSIENLIWVGGMESLGLTRRELLWQVGLWLGPEDEPDRTTGRQSDAQLDLALDDPFAGVRFAGLDDSERLEAEYRMLHFSTELHPLHLLRSDLPRGTVTADQLPDLPQGSTVQVAGVVVARQRPQTARGYVFVLMEDEAGHINAIVKPKIYERDRSAVRMEPFLLVRGRLQKDGATINVIAHRVSSLRVGGPGREQALGTRRPQARQEPGTDAHAAGPALLDRLSTEMPGVLEGWGPAARGASPPPDPHRKNNDGNGRDGPRGFDHPRTENPFKFLTALRQSPPGIKSFG